MPSDRAERRRAQRRVPASTEPLSRVRLRAGPELAIVNVSATGALAEGAFRLLPGTHVEVHVTTARGRTLVRARIVRCRVCDVAAGRVGYQGAFAFGAVLDVSPGRLEPGTSFP